MDVRNACVTLLSPDPETLLDFYCGLLGLEIRFQGPRFAELAAPDGFRLALMRQETASAPAAGAALGFSVADWSAARLELETRGLLDREEEDRGSGVRLLWFHDPEGRSLYLWDLL